MNKNSNIVLKDFTDGMDVMLHDPKMKTVTVFCYPLSKVKSRVRITRIGKHLTDNPNEFRVSFEKPNFIESKFLGECKKAKCNPRRTLLKYYR